MQKMLQNTSTVSFYFFLVLGMLHIVASLLVVQGAGGKTAAILVQSLDLPFLTAALTYGSLQISQRLEQVFGQVKTPLIICGATSILIFSVALYFNFAIPDAPIL